MKQKIATLAVVAIVLLVGLVTDKDHGTTSNHTDIQYRNQVLRTAFEERKTNLQVSGRGLVIRLLPDDEKGSRHQRFLLETATGQRLLIAHNIDLAPRVRQLEPGDELEFLGEYEWNNKGGVIHWTHHDPRGRHIDGFLRHKGRVYK